MAAQPSGDVCQDRVAVFQLDCKGRARKNLLNRPEDFEWRLFGKLDFGLYPGAGGAGFRAAAGYDWPAFLFIACIIRYRGYPSRPKCHICEEIGGSGRRAAWSERLVAEVLDEHQGAVRGGSNTDAHVRIVGI